MSIDLLFIFNSVMLGLGLAMDAFSVSMANGLNEPKMHFPKMCLVAGLFAFFQALMPLLGWVCVHTVLEYFGWLAKFVPVIALLLLGYIGGKMFFDGFHGNEEEEPSQAGIALLFIQGIATSIDALSVGFTIAEYNFPMALSSAMIIGVVTFFICLAGVKIGKTFGMKLSNKATILGGAILIFIGLEIFISSFF